MCNHVFCTLLITFSWVAGHVLHSRAPRLPTRAHHARTMNLQLFHSLEGDGEGGGEVDDAVRSASAAVGGEVASVQFMITQRMRERLEELGYAEADIDELEPQKAAEIVQASVMSSATGVKSAEKLQKKAKTKRDRFQLQFTCNVCNGRNSHSISRHAYSKGTVIVTCPTCNSTHLIADNLKCALPKSNLARVQPSFLASRDSKSP